MSPHCPTPPQPDHTSSVNSLEDARTTHASQNVMDPTSEDILFPSKSLTSAAAAVADLVCDNVQQSGNSSTSSSVLPRAVTSEKSSSETLPSQVTDKFCSAGGRERTEEEIEAELLASDDDETSSTSRLIIDEEPPSCSGPVATPGPSSAGEVEPCVSSSQLLRDYAFVEQELLTQAEQPSQSVAGPSASPTPEGQMQPAVVLSPLKATALSHPTDKDSKSRRAIMLPPPLFAPCGKR